MATRVLLVSVLAIVGDRFAKSPASRYVALPPWLLRLAEIGKGDARRRGKGMP
jgi:hypothetical protein